MSLHQVESLVHFVSNRHASSDNGENRWKESSALTDDDEANDNLQKWRPDNIHDLQSKEMKKEFPNTFCCLKNALSILIYKAVTVVE